MGESTHHPSSPHSPAAVFTRPSSLPCMALRTKTRIGPSSLHLLCAASESWPLFVCLFVCLFVYGFGRQNTLNDRNVWLGFIICFLQPMRVTLQRGLTFLGITQLDLDINDSLDPFNFYYIVVHTKEQKKEKKIFS